MVDNIFLWVALGVQGVVMIILLWALIVAIIKGDDKDD